MYRIRVKKEFSAAHFIPGYDGKCQYLHGHNWVVEVFFSSYFLCENGLLIDFKIVKKRLDKILETLDHTNLNDLDYFQRYSPSCENICKYIFDKLLIEFLYEIRNKNLILEKVRIWESENAYAEYLK